jgi:hypothetical protein
MIVHKLHHDKFTPLTLMPLDLLLYLLGFSDLQRYVIGCHLTLNPNDNKPHPLLQKMFPPSSWVVFFLSMQFIPYRLVFYDGSKHDKVCDFFLNLISKKNQH